MKDWQEMTSQMLRSLLDGSLAEKKAWSAASLKDGALLLDIDGTLVLTDDIYFAVFTDLLAPYGYKVDKPFYEKNVHGKVDADVFQALMPSHYGPEELKAVSEKKDALFCAKARQLGVPIIPGLGEALAIAKEHGIRCIAVTNAPRGAGALCVEEIKKQFEAGDIIEDLVIGAECTRAKPFADPYIEGMKRLGKKPEECIVFEDSRSGIAAGKAAGVSAIVGIRSNLDDAKLRAHGATATMKDWQELTPEMLVGLLNSSTLTTTDCVRDQVQSDKSVVLHLCGSMGSEYYEGVSMIYGSECFKAVTQQGTYKHQLCFVHLDGSWSFPEDTSEEGKAAAVRMSFPQAMGKIAELKPHAVVPHMFCLPGLTDFRALFDTMGLPIVGNPADVMALSEDKWKTKAVVAASGVKVPHAEVLRNGEMPTLKPPFLLKPCSEANSQGVSLVRPGDDVQKALDLAFSFDHEVLCEEYVALGRELRVAGLEMQDGSLKVLPCIEYFLTDKEPIRTAQQKLTTNDRGVPTTFAPVNRKCPADIDEVLMGKLQDMVERSHKALGCRDYSLYDVRVDPNGEPYFIEACLYCSFAPKSVIVAMGASLGLEQKTIYEMLVDRTIDRKKKADVLRAEGKMLGMRN